MHFFLPTKYEQVLSKQSWISQVWIFFFQMNRPGKYVKSYGYIQKRYNNEP